jgi:glutathione reductase (NADPH)
MPTDFDLLVIGTGVAGNSVAQQCREAGWKVAIAENRLPGGACALRACDPKKVLLSAAEGLDWVDRLRGKGLVTQEAHIDWTDLMRFKRGFTENVPGNTIERYQEAGIILLKGTARFTDTQAVEVAGNPYTAEKILIATGSVPAPLPFEGNEYLVNSDYFLDMDKFELAHLATRAGAQVQILEHGPTPLKGFDPYLVEQLLKASRAAGIDIRLNIQIEALDYLDNHYQLYFTNDAGKHALEADLVVHGAGRLPWVQPLELKKANVELNEKGGIRVNDWLQSETNPHVYAAGDAVGTFPALTPVASLHARHLAKHWLQRDNRPFGNQVISSVAFTIPPIASVGLHEAEAKEQGLETKVAQGSMADWYAYRRIGEAFAGYKTITDSKTGKLLGAHLLGHHSDELINLFALAIQHGLTANDLKEMVYTYPTHASNISSMLP